MNERKIATRTRRSITVQSEAAPGRARTGQEDDTARGVECPATCRSERRASRSTQSLCRGNAEPSDGQSVRFREQRVIAARNAGPMLVDVLEIGVSSDPLALAEFQRLFATDC